MSEAPQDSPEPCTEQKCEKFLAVLEDGLDVRWQWTS
jgi:hypothetical protein